MSILSLKAVQSRRCNIADGAKKVIEGARHVDREAVKVPTVPEHDDFARQNNTDNSYIDHVFNIKRKNRQLPSKKAVQSSEYQTY